MWWYRYIDRVDANRRCSERRGSSRGDAGSDGAVLAALELDDDGGAPRRAPAETAGLGSGAPSRAMDEGWRGTAAQAGTAAALEIWTA